MGRRMQSEEHKQHAREGVLRYWERRYRERAEKVGEHFITNEEFDGHDCGRVPNAEDGCKTCDIFFHQRRKINNRQKIKNKIQKYGKHEHGKHGKRKN